MSAEYLKKLDQIKEAKERWQESEWLLEFLRTQGSEPNPKTEQEILIWNSNLPRT